MVDASSLGALLRARVAESPEDLMLVEAEGAITFRDFDQRVASLAGRLAERVDARRPVAWMLPTSIETGVLAAALNVLGIEQIPLLPAYGERELGVVVRQTGAGTIITVPTWRDMDLVGRATAATSDLPDVEVLVLGDLDLADPAMDPNPPPRSDAGDWIFFTSGTTADPKGARHGDRGLLAAANAIVSGYDVTEADRVALVFPMAHIGGIAWIFATLMTGCRLLLDDVFSPPRTIEFLDRQGVTLAGAGTPFHRAYLDAAARWNGQLFRSVRGFPGGASPKPPDMHERLIDVFGVGVLSAYGLTECPVCVITPVSSPDWALATTEGVAALGVEIRIVAGGGLAAPGTEGEVRLKGPQLFRGYIDGSLDAEAFDDDGYFRTGDLGVLDAAGYLKITGRLKDVIIRKGENISAKELEDVLGRLPTVSEVAVVGLPDESRGELCCAVVVPVDPDAPPSLADLADACRDAGLARHKTPERVETVETLPRNAMGKLLKRELRERLALTDN